jgi:hypothetical protein
VVAVSVDEVADAVIIGVGVDVERLEAQGADVVEADGEPTITGETAAELAVAVARGETVLRTHHVRVARRVVDVWAAIAEARD